MQRKLGYLSLGAAAALLVAGCGGQQGNSNPFNSFSNQNSFAPMPQRGEKAPDKNSPEVREATGRLTRGEAQRILQTSLDYSLKTLGQKMPARQANFAVSPVGYAQSFCLAMGIDTSDVRRKFADEFGSSIQPQEAIAITRSLQTVLRSSDASVQPIVISGLFMPTNQAVPATLAETAPRDFDAVAVTLPPSRAEAKSALERWVSGGTMNRITEIPDSLTFDSPILLSAIAVGGDWGVPITTDQLSFTPLQGEAVSAPSLQAKGNIETFSDRDHQAVRIPMGTGRFQLTLIQPRAEASQDPLTRPLTQDRLRQIRRGLRKQQMTVQWPQFDGSYFVAPTDTLTVSPSSFAQLIRFTPSRESDVAALAAANRNQSNRPANNHNGEEAKEMSFDRPFLWVLEDSDSSMILLLGVYYRPANTTAAP
ncbi:MAG: serpin family protein [Fimbriimonadaceae bacterium]